MHVIREGPTWHPISFDYTGEFIMASLEDTVRSVVQDLIKNEVLFTALDVSNTVKQSQPHARHREVRDVVRGMFTTDIESQGWAKTPITVTLQDGSTAEAILYHPLTDSWDLDNKYSTQQRSAVSFKPATAAAATVALAQAQATAPATTAAQTQMTTGITGLPLNNPPAPAPTPAPAPRDQWASLFSTTPSLFPSR
jgi:hypothetical protein